jgi:YD repeat-containing protein
VIAGFAMRYHYDAAGNLVRVTNPGGYALSFEYDGANRVLRAYDQAGHTVARTLDLDGRPRTVTDPNGSTVMYEYYGPERDGRLKTKIDPMGRATTYDYDANGNVTVVTDALGRTTITAYDELDRPTRVAGPVYTDPTRGLIRPVTRTTYNLLGFVTMIEAGYTDASGANAGSDVVRPQMTYSRDDFGRKLMEQDALDRIQRFTYDRHGNVLTVTDARDRTVDMTYGYGGQLLSRVERAPTTGPLVPLSGAARSWTTTETVVDDPPQGYAILYRGGICVRDGAGACVGGDALLESGVGARIGYLKTTADAGKADRAWQALFGHTAYNTFPRHARSLDVGCAVRSGEILTLGGATEFFQLVEKVEGVLYRVDLERLLAADRTALDTERAVALARFLGHAHAVKHDDPAIYQRRIRELVGHGECVMGILDSYPHPYPLLPAAACEAIEHAAVSWRWRLRDRTHRLARTHGDFHA